MINSERTIQIMGIPCRLKKAESIKVVRRVFAQIKASRPKDFERLTIKVERIVGFHASFGGSDYDGTVGQWFGNQYDHDVPGQIVIAENVGHDEFLVNLAHELGHAATRDEDVRRRMTPSDEWDSELSADWYIYQWGFGRLAKKVWKSNSRVFSHHAVGPGKIIKATCGPDPNVYAVFRVTRNFVMVDTGIREPVPDEDRFSLSRLE